MADGDLVAQLVHEAAAGAEDVDLDLGEGPAGAPGHLGVAQPLEHRELEGPPVGRGHAAEDPGELPAEAGPLGVGLRRRGAVGGFGQGVGLVVVGRRLHYQPGPAQAVDPEVVGGPQEVAAQVVVGSQGAGADRPHEGLVEEVFGLLAAAHAAQGVPQHGRRVRLVGGAPEAHVPRVGRCGQRDLPRNVHGGYDTRGRRWLQGGPGRAIQVGPIERCAGGPTNLPVRVVTKDPLRTIINESPQTSGEENDNAVSGAGMIAERSFQPSSSLLSLSGNAVTPDDLATVALHRVLELTGGSAGIIALFDHRSEESDRIAVSHHGLQAETVRSRLHRWKRDLPLGRAADSPTSSAGLRRAKLPPPSGGGQLERYLFEERRIAGILRVEDPRRTASNDACRERLDSLAAEFVAAAYRNILVRRLSENGAGPALVGRSPVFLRLEQQIRNAAAHDAGAVLITGERGSGKEIAAWGAHLWSQRWRAPFVPILGSAFSPQLFASELFGHERNAFTGAEARRKGRIEVADGGTIFLDEVADLPREVQSALLRLVEYGEIARPGRDLPVSVDVRVVAATNRSLDAVVREGGFREDLLDRLRMIDIRVPPLRERRSDIRGLAELFLRRHCRKFRRSRAFAGSEVCSACASSEPPCCTEAFFETLEGYHWPGNVRELENLMIHVQVRHPGEVLDRHHLPPFVQVPERDGGGAGEGDDLTLEAVVRSHIERVLAANRFNQTRAAETLGLPLSTMRSKMKKLGITIPDS